MIIDILPNSLYSLPNICTLLDNKNSSILYKTLNEDLTNKELFLSSVAIVFIVKGNQIIKNHDGQEAIVNEGQMVYLSKDIYLVSDFVTDDNKFEAVLFFMGDRFIEKYLLNSRHKILLESNNNMDTIHVSKANMQINRYINSLIEIYKNSENSKKILDIKLMELLYLIDLQDGDHKFLSSLSCYDLKSEKRNIKNFMQNNYLKNLSIQDYALLTGRSVSTFIRDFKKIYYKTPNQWLIDQRLRMAHKLLKETDLSVTEVAGEIGYENISHFIKAYKNKYGHTPGTSKNIHR